MSPLVLAVDDVQRGRLAAPLGFACDGSHYGLIWHGSRELRGGPLHLSTWLASECLALSEQDPSISKTTD
jgi:hypothetical protein